jgi:hypothetical protein
MYYGNGPIRDFINLCIVDEDFIRLVLYQLWCNCKWRPKKPQDRRPKRLKPKRFQVGFGADVGASVAPNLQCIN